MAVVVLRMTRRSDVLPRPVLGRCGTCPAILHDALPSRWLRSFLSSFRTTVGSKEGGVVSLGQPVVLSPSHHRGFGGRERPSTGVCRPRAYPGDPTWTTRVARGSLEWTSARVAHRLDLEQPTFQERPFDTTWGFDRRTDRTVREGSWTSTSETQVGSRDPPIGFGTECSTFQRQG